MYAADTQKQNKDIDEKDLSSKIIDEVYDVLEKYSITGEGLREFFWCSVGSRVRM